MDTVVVERSVLCRLNRAVTKDKIIFYFWIKKAVANDIRSIFYASSKDKAMDGRKRYLLV